jgi:hypothetical protein
MSKAIRTTVSLGVSLVLFGALAMAQASGNNGDQNKNKEHHSRLAKAAFWRHHKNADTKPKQAEATPVPSKQAQVKKAAIKPVSAKQAAGNKDPKQGQHASNMSKPPANKTPAVGKTSGANKTTAANKTKAQQKSQSPTTVSSKQ